MRTAQCFCGLKILTSWLPKQLSGLSVGGAISSQATPALAETSPQNGILLALLKFSGGGGGAAFLGVGVVALGVVGVVGVVVGVVGGCGETLAP